MANNSEELRSLLVDWEAGTLDELSTQRLREILRQDESARTEFAQHQLLTTALILENGAKLDRFAPPDQSPEIMPTSASRTSGRRGFSRHAVMIGAVSLLFVCLIGRIIFLEFDDSPATNNVVGALSNTESSSEATSSGVALITELVDVQWTDAASTGEVGDAVAPGTFSLLSGLVQLEFFCGATVILEGPAELQLESTTVARLKHGRLRAQVPPAARGFSLHVEDMTVVDLGTEFGLSATPEASSVQVFDGEVELHPHLGDKRSLTAGQAVTRRPDGSYQSATVTPESFVDIPTLQSRAQNEQTARFTRWQEWSEQLRTDSRLIAYYAFDQATNWNRKLSNSLLPLNSELDGAIVGANQRSGRWPGKQALEFKRPGDRVRVQIPGEFGSLTLACWVKIDSLDRQYNSLFLTDNYNQGEPHWQILHTGQLYFSVRPSEDPKAGPRDYKALSPSFWQPDLSGRWIHLATVYDIDDKAITHYMNGAVLSHHLVPASQVVATHIGIASIGNWSIPTLPDANFAIRNLNGSIDEFALFAAALEAEDIDQMYEIGKP